MVSANGGDVWRAHVAMAAGKILFGGNNVISKVALNVGVNQLIFCVYRDLLALSIITPLAFFREKRLRPPLNRDFLTTFVFLGLTGVFGFQLLHLIGLGYTNPTYAAASLAATPVFTFILAVMMGTETVNLRKTEDLTKLGGTLVSVSGAILMTMFRGPAVFGSEQSDTSANSVIISRGLPEAAALLISSFLQLGIDNWQLGVLCLIASCMCMAAYLAFQARLLEKYPASISVTAYSYFFGAIFMLVPALLMTNGSTDWHLTPSEALAVCYAGVIASALNYVMLAWSNKILGPTLVALYTPVSPVATAFLSKIFLGSPIYLESIVGGLLIIAGLYLVTWASYRERRGNASELLIDRWSASEPLVNRDSESISEIWYQTGPSESKSKAVD